MPVGDENQEAPREPAETVAVEGGKWHLEMQKNKVYSAPVQTQEESAPESEHRVFVLSTFYTI